jgi:hypothetical protein
MVGSFQKERRTLSLLEKWLAGRIDHRLPKHISIQNVKLICVKDLEELTPV